MTFDDSLFKKNSKTDCGIAILLAVPYGMLADWIGYRPVALLAFFGNAMSSNWSRVVC